MTTENNPVESVEIADTNTSQHCSNCRHAIPSILGARMWCYVTSDNQPLAYWCCRWQQRGGIDAAE